MEAGLNASLELQRRETMGIRTKHFGASFEAGLEAGLEGLKAMEIGENNVTKKVPVLVLKTYEKAGAQKWASPVSVENMTSEIGVYHTDGSNERATSFFWILLQHLWLAH